MIPGDAELNAAQTHCGGGTFLPCADGYVAKFDTHLSCAASLARSALKAGVFSTRSSHFSHPLCKRHCHYGIMISLNALSGPDYYEEFASAVRGAGFFLALFSGEGGSCETFSPLSLSDSLCASRQILESFGNTLVGGGQMEICVGVPIRSKSTNRCNGKLLNSGSDFR